LLKQETMRIDNHLMQVDQSKSTKTTVSAKQDQRAYPCYTTLPSQASTETCSYSF
jgi:hypothetical protein